MIEKNNVLSWGVFLFSVETSFVEVLEFYPHHHDCGHLN